MFEERNGGYFKPFQPFFGYLGAVCTLLVVFFFNTASLWNGTRIGVKATSAFVSPILVFSIWILKKLFRRDDRRFKFFLNLSNFRQFENRLQALDDLIYPGEVADAGSLKYDINMSPIHDQHIQFIPDDRHDTSYRQQDPIAPDQDVNNAPPSLNRTNITFTPVQNDAQPESFRSAVEHQPPVSPVQNMDIERDLVPNRRYEAMSVPHHSYNRLSPLSASSRGGLRNIHEADAELDASSMAGSEGSQTRLHDTYR